MEKVKGSSAGHDYDLSDKSHFAFAFPFALVKVKLTTPLKASLNQTSE